MDRKYLLSAIRCTDQALQLMELIREYDNDDEVAVAAKRCKDCIQLAVEYFNRAMMSDKNTDIKAHKEGKGPETQREEDAKADVVEHVFDITGRPILAEFSDWIVSALADDLKGKPLYVLQNFNPRVIKLVCRQGPDGYGGKWEWWEVRVGSSPSVRLPVPKEMIGLAKLVVAMEFNPYEVR